MKYSVLTGTGLTVSRFCLGTMTFGGQVSEEEGIRILHTAIDRGINFIDTANTYTGGASERITGKGIKEHRHQLILASKVCNPVNKETAGPNEMGLTRRNIRDSVIDSLRRLDTDYLDIYYLHKPDYLTPLEETLGAMNSLVREGLVRYIGISNYASWQLMDMLWICDKRNFILPLSPRTCIMSSHAILNKSWFRVSLPKKWGWSSLIPSRAACFPVSISGACPHPVPVLTATRCTSTGSGTRTASAPWMS